MEETKHTEVQENKMGVLPVNQLLLSMAIPMMISMLVQALYNVVDSIFVARISENALNAVSLAFPHPASRQTVAFSAPPPPELVFATTR